jgi:hypothetical protein
MQVVLDLMLSDGDAFEVVGIDAERVPAGVVNLVSFGDRAVSRLVVGAVGG